MYIAAVVTVGTLAVASLAGYAFARIRFPGANALFVVVLTGLLIPSEVTIVPLFQMFRRWGMINTHWPLILVPIFGAPSVLATFIMRQFFIALPGELEEAARVDGLGRFAIFRQIALPLARPALGAVAIFTFLHSWNLYLEPIVFLSTPGEVHPAAGADPVRRRLRRPDVERPARRRVADRAAGAGRVRHRADASSSKASPTPGSRDRSFMAEVQLSHRCRSASAPPPSSTASTFDIRDGDFVALVGPSGCGKSTLLRMIAGLEPVTRAESTSAGGVTDLDPKDRDIAMVFQNYALYPHMTVAANMGFSLEHRGRPKAEIAERVRWAAGILGLDELLERYPRQLSGGQRQRVAMGRAIVRDPQVFLFDEPLSNLDAKLRIVMRGEIKALHQTAQDHHALCHPRPGRSHDHGRCDRRAQRRACRAGRRAAGIV